MRLQKYFQNFFKNCAVILAMFFLCTFSARADSGSGTDAPSARGALHVDGAKLVGNDGEQVQLRGVSTHGLAWFPDYVNPDCFAELKSWGANVVRLAPLSSLPGTVRASLGKNT